MKTRLKNYKICHCDGTSLKMTVKGVQDKIKTESQRLAPKILEMKRESAERKAEQAIEWLFKHQKNYQNITT